MEYVNRVKKKDQKNHPRAYYAAGGDDYRIFSDFCIRYLIVEILRENSTRAQLDYLWLLVD